MTPETFVDFSLCLQFLPNGTAPAWNTDCARFYFAALDDIPDIDAGKLTKSVAIEFTFRPTPHDILALWRKAKANGVVQPAEIVAELCGLRDKYGEHGVRHDQIEPGQARYTIGPPPELTGPACQVVAAMGGWVDFCRDESPAGVQRGQLLKIAQMVLGNDSDGAIERLRAEYQEQRAALLPPEPDLIGSMILLEQNGESPNTLTRLGNLKLPERSAKEKG